MSAHSVLFLDSEKVDKCLDRRELLQKLEGAFGEFSKGAEGGVVQPVRTVLPVNKHNGYFGLMPAYMSAQDMLAAKLVTFFPDNKECSTHQAWILCLNPANGSLNAIVDGEKVTAIRTAAASAVATKYLAKKDSKILAILGSGTQARSHYEILKLLYDFEQVRIWSNTFSSAEKLAEGVSKGVAFKTVEEAVQDADIICTVSFATTPILNGRWVKPGAHINAVGACRPNWSEVDSDLMCSAVVYCDTKEACLKEAGDIILSGCDIYAEIGEVILGTKDAQPEKTTVFKSVGMAMEDVVSAQIVYDNYIKTEKEDT